MTTYETNQEREATVDSTLEDTFPASDPPAWTLGRDPKAPPPSSPPLQRQTQTDSEVTKKEEKKVTLLGIAGSLRRDSYNRALLFAAQELMPANSVLEIFDIAGIPLFNEDDEHILPTQVVELKARICSADAILIATPEYNYSIPGVLKNAIDWASRPPGDNVWSGKPVAIVGASVGKLGTVRAQYHLRQVFVTLNMPTLNQPEVMVSNAAERFDSAGNLTDQETKTLLQKLLTQFVIWTRQFQRTHA